MFQLFLQLKIGAAKLAIVCAEIKFSKKRNIKGKQECKQKPTNSTFYKIFYPSNSKFAGNVPYKWEGQIKISASEQI